MTCMRGANIVRGMRTVITLSDLVIWRKVEIVTNFIILLKDKQQLWRQIKEVFIKTYRRNLSLQSFIQKKS